MTYGFASEFIQYELAQFYTVDEMLFLFICCFFLFYLAVRSVRHALVVPEVKVVILRVFPVEGGGLWGTPMSYMSSLITVVSPTKSKNCPPHLC